MILENVTIDWRCKNCGTVRRVDVHDPTKSVAGYRPAGWMLDRGQVNCDVCDTQAPTPSPAARTTEAPNLHGSARSEAADALRAQMAGLRSGRTGQEAYSNMRQGVGGIGGVTVRDAEGRQSQIPLRGEGGQLPQSPPRTIPGSDGQSSASVVHEEPGVAPSTSAREFRPGGGNVVFEDTRGNEFLGPEKTVAAIPHLMNNCIGCGLKIQTGVDSGVAEAWRFANGSSVERGHPDCLYKMGR